MLPWALQSAGRGPWGLWPACRPGVGEGGSGPAQLEAEKSAWLWGVLKLQGLQRMVLGFGKHGEKLSTFGRPAGGRTNLPRTLCNAVAYLGIAHTLKKLSWIARRYQIIAAENEVVRR